MAETATLTVPLVGPLQSWSLSGPHRERVSEAYPTKCGVVGLLACCLGRPRGADARDLAALRVHVRIDRPGTRLMDFQTITGFLRASRRSDPGTIFLTREYLEGAAFTVALEGDRDLLETLHAALRAPVWAPYLGRRNCPPARPLGSGTLAAVGAEAALGQAPSLTGQGGRMPAFFEAEGPLLRRDVPAGRRQFTERRLRAAQLEVPA